MRKKRILHKTHNLAYWREVRGLTQAELARLMGVTDGAISQWELGKCLPSPEKASRLAFFLRCRPDDIFPVRFGIR